MTAKRNRHKQSVQPKVIEIATRKYLAIAIVITFLLSVILTVIQIVSLSGYTSHLADTGARQLEQRLELALQNIQSNASMLRVSRETAKLSQTVSFTEEALRSINYMETLNTIKLTDDALYDIWVLNEDRGVVYTASRTRYSADVPAIRNIVEETAQEAWDEGFAIAQVDGYPGQEISRSCLIYRQRLDVSDVGFHGAVYLLLDCKKLYASLLEHNDSLEELMVLTHDGRTVCSQPMNSQPVGARVEAAIDFLASPTETYQHWVDGGKICSAYRGRHFLYVVWVSGDIVIMTVVQQALYALIVLAVFIMVIVISFRMIARQMNRPIAELQATLERQLQEQSIPTDTAREATNVLTQVSEQWHASDGQETIQQMDLQLYEAVTSNKLTESMLVHLASFDHYVFLLCDIDEPHQHIVEARKLSPFLDYLLRYSLRGILGEGESSYTVRINEWSIAAAVSFQNSPSEQARQALMDKSSALMQAFTTCTLSFSCSSVFSGREHVAEALNEAKRAIRWKLVRGVGCTILYTPGMGVSRSFTFPQAKIQSIVSSIDRGENAIHERLRELLAKLLESDAGMDDLEFAVSQLLGVLIQTAFRKGVQFNALFDEPEHSPFRYLSSFDTLEHMLTWLEGKFVQLSRQLAKAHKGGSGYTNKFIRYIGDHYAESLTPEDVASALGISYSYLRKIISTEMGTTFSAYLLGIRLEKMKELLVNTTISQRDIAEQVGIGSEQTMYRLFKQYMGCSPGEYRKHPSADSTIAAETADEYHESEE